MIVLRSGGPRPRWCALVMAFFLVGLAEAATFPNLYTVTVTPSADVQDRRADGVRLAMGRLLTRVTGRRDAGWDPEFVGLIEGAQQYVEAIGFPDPARPDLLQVAFNPRSVEAELTRLNRPVWGPERPLTLLWIAIDGAFGERGIVPAGPLGAEWSPEMQAVADQLREVLLAVADERGLPITLPLLDLEDINALGFADIWGGFADRIEQASARYAADAVLIGRVRPGAFGIEAQWSLIEEGRARPVGGAGLRDGLDWLADHFAAEFATVGGARAARIKVLDVRTLEDYGRLMRYLENLSVLESVQVESLEQSALTLRLAARGDGGVLERVLTLDGMLRPAAGDTRQVSTEDTLVFQLTR